MTWRERVFGRRWRLRPAAEMAVYAQIEEQIGDRIAVGELPAGARLPSERELAAGLGVSRATVRQALASLAERGLVERGVGRGTFVARTKLDHDLSRVTGLTERLERQGLRAGARVRGVVLAPPPRPVVEALGIDGAASAWRLERVRLAADVPVALEDSWLPAERFPDLDTHDLTGSIYDLLERAYDSRPERAVERLEPVAAGAAHARALRVAPGSPLMLVERVAFAGDGGAVEFARDRYRGDRARFVVHSDARTLDHA